MTKAHSTNHFLQKFLSTIYPILRPLFFLFPAETAHHLTLKSLSYLHKLFPSMGKNLQANTTTLFGLSFPNKVGLAAGLDKNGEYIDALAALGFGFIEVGTVTPKPQRGNPKPRLFRIPKSEALLNRMGFNNEGVDQLIENIKNSKFDGILGINIGKNATTPIENAVDDYVFCLKEVYPYASYITINISSPNTAGLRQLQNENNLDTLLDTLKKTQQECEKQFNKYVPLLIKISPDLASNEIENIAMLLLKHHIDGVIATNTTLSRDGVDSLYANEAGGLSGKPLFARSLETVRCLYKHLGSTIPIIACGGIFSKEEAKAVYAVGARLIQIYSGLIYKGPALVDEVKSCEQQNEQPVD